MSTKHRAHVSHGVTEVADQFGFIIAGELIRQRGLSTRSGLQLLKVARTIADLSNQADVNRQVVAEASCYRCTDLLKQSAA